MQIQIDFRSGIPIYIQLVEQIRQKIAAGELKPGDQLPTMRQLATDLRVNWNTVARAYRMLDEAGLISTQHGRGTYIWDLPSKEAAEMLRHEALEGLTRRYLVEAARLEITPAELEATFSRLVAEWKTGEITNPSVSEI